MKMHCCLMRCDSMRLVSHTVMQQCLDPAHKTEPTWLCSSFRRLSSRALLAVAAGAARGDAAALPCCSTSRCFSSAASCRCARSISSVAMSSSERNPACLTKIFQADKGCGMIWSFAQTRHSVMHAQPGMPVCVITHGLLRL